MQVGLTRQCRVQRCEGPGSIQQAHQPDEYVTLDQLARCELFLQGLAGVQSIKEVILFPTLRPEVL